MKIPNIINISFFLAILFIISSCASKQQITSEETQIIPKPKLLFLNYKISKPTNEEKTIVLINQLVTDGKLKNKSTVEGKLSLGDLEYTLLDADFNEIEKNSIKNPLIKIVEFINDLGNFEKKIIALDSAQFSLKLQLPSKAKHIVISELTNNSIKKYITTKINYE